MEAGQAGESAAVHVGNGSRESAEALLMDKAVFDREVALAQVDGDLDLLSELATIFMEEASELLIDMRRSIIGRDSKTLERLAHTMKGSARTLGAGAVAEVAFQLELHTREGSFSGAAAACDSLQGELTRLDGALAPVKRLAPSVDDAAQK